MEEREPPKPAAVSLAQRQAEHDARIKKKDAQEKAGAPGRAAKVQEYERKKRESEQRQRDIAAKKMEKAEQESGLK